MNQGHANTRKTRFSTVEKGHVSCTLVIKNFSWQKEGEVDVLLLAGMHTASIPVVPIWRESEVAGRLEGTGQELLCPCKALHEEV